MVSIAILVYNMCLVAGTAYVVFELNESGWWFLVAYFFLMVKKDKEDGS